MQLNINQQEKFANRHLGYGESDKEAMLQASGFSSMDELIDKTIPSSIRLKQPMDLSTAIPEQEFLRNLKKIASKNKVYKSYIGMGYFDTYVPNVILRNIMENPGWYTQYTPYQAEIAQGRLEALLNFQTMVMDLTGMELANASLLDEGTAAAEAMGMFKALNKKGDKPKFFVDEEVYPQTKEVIETRAAPMQIELVYGVFNETTLDDSFFGALVQYPNEKGAISDYRSFTESATELNIPVCAVADLLSLSLITPPGEWGASTVVGTTQRFGVPMGYGGPHAAYFATKDEYKRNIPGRIIGVSIDRHGNRALRMALQTREQHIRRQSATSNICTAQVLLAIMAGMYGVYHGPDGIKGIASRIHSQASVFETAVKSMGYEQLNESYFDTLYIKAPNATQLKQLCEANEVNLRFFDNDCVGVAFDETKTVEDLQQLVDIFAEAAGKSTVKVKSSMATSRISKSLERNSNYMFHPVFNSYQSEHEMLRYIKRLESKDLSLCHSMISLGSCTMKLNATAEMIPVTWPEFNGIHPFAPQNQVVGYNEILSDLENDLAVITGFHGTSLQPNAGAQGEYTGLLTIKAYLEDKGEGHRHIALIPSSAHGTNPASAVMAGMKVVVTKCDEKGNIDVTDLKEKAELHKDNLACLMVTYPSTHGVFETAIKEITQLIHDNGGQVYMDGANMNAQVGLTNPGMIGADVCHLNLHKTFCIPHGGGGPGMGPICVAEHLTPFLPNHGIVPVSGEKGITAVSAAPYGSASILLISYAYIKMMGVNGLTDATKYAILNANYIKSRLEGEYDVLYTGEHGNCAHEMILDTREFKKTAQVEAEDIAKRLMDYGYHAPTLSFPVAGTLMIEPTESESKEELDRFCDTMLSIRQEIRAIENGTMSQEDNVLVNAPHTAAEVVNDAWSHAYGREEAAYPLSWVHERKFWPSVGRVNSTYGDRNLICACLPMEAYEEEAATS
jgi:glycine dehydrogenase